jgi:DNA-binding HxlR family transcriptional regulator
MGVEWSAAVLSRARVHAALGEPARLAIMNRLLLGDASPNEIGYELAVPNNLLAHHVKLLETADIVERSQSKGDHRRTYLRLHTPALAGLVPVAELDALRTTGSTHNARYPVDTSTVSRIGSPGWSPS